MTSYIQHQKTADEVVADLDGQITERLARNFGNMTLWHADAATLLRRYREMVGEISTLRAQQETDRVTIAALSAPSPSADALRSGGDDAVGAAERDVGRYIYQRIETLMDAKHVTSIGNELDYLATIAAAVEEYGSEHCAGEDLSVFREPQEGVSAPLVGSDFSVSQSQPCTNGSPDPVLTLPQHSDGEALAYFETFVKRKDEMDRMGYGLRAEEWPGFVSVMRAALAAAPSEPS